MSIKFNTTLSEAEMNKIEAYVESIERLAQQRDPTVFTSSNAQNAAIVMGTILRLTSKEVRMYDHCLNGDIADQNTYFMNGLSSFLEEGKNLKIVLRDGNDYDSGIFEQLSLLSGEYSNQIDIRLASEEFISNVVDVVEKDVNFIVNDTDAFRLEVVEHSASNLREAVSSFNKKDVADTLIDLFDAGYKTCTPHKLLVHA